MKTVNSFKHDLEDNLYDTTIWKGYLRLYILTFIFIAVPNMFGVPLTWCDVFLIPLNTVYIWYAYLMVKQSELIRQDLPIKDTK